MHRPSFPTFSVFLLIALWGGTLLADAEEKPLLELGMGIGGLSSAHYPGSDESYHHVLPVPYVVYRGEHIQADRSGLTAILADNEKLELSLSAHAGLPVESDDNGVREGMPDLGWLLELGPVLRYIALETEGGSRLRFDLPLRAAFSLEDANLEHRGWTASPGVVLEHRYRDWKVTASALAMFGDRRYHGYFYDVESPYATAERPYFRAQAGYTATRLGLSTSRRLGDWYVGGFIHAYALNGAENLDSPLVRDRSNFAAGFMVSRVFYRSKARARSHRDD